MGMVSTSLRMFDMMTAPLLSVFNNTMKVTGAMDNLANSANSEIYLDNSLNDVTNAINNTTIGLDDMIQKQDSVSNNQERMNNNFNHGSNAAENLTRKIRSLIGTYAGLQAIKKGIEATDNYINQSSRLTLINDGLQSQAELQQKIYEAAERSRGAYGDTVSTVAKLGLLAKDAFKSNSETIAFAELMNKSFKVSGASASEASNGMYQLTQAMAAGRLQGDEFRSVMENAPMLAQAIATYTGKSIGELRELSSEGKITSDVIKNSLFSAAEDINAKFETMPKTFESIWTSIKNQALREFSGIMQEVNNFINSSNGAALINGITNSVSILSNVIGFLIDSAINVSTVFIENWSWIEPIVLGIAFTMGIFTAATIANSIANGINTFIQTAQAIAIAVKTGATIADTAATNKLTVAQWALNSSLLASPITWVIIGVIALIVVFYAAIAAINKFAGTSLSATGMIAGAFMVALAFIGNIFVGVGNLISGIFVSVYNLVATFANFIATCFNNPVVAVAGLFLDLFNTITGVVESAAGLIDALLGTNMNKAIAGFRGKIADFTAEVTGESRVEVMSLLNPSDYTLNRFEYGEAYNAGDKFGRSIEEKFDINKLLGKDLFNKDFSNDMSQLDSIKDYTKNIDDKIDVSNEHLALLRDLAEQESIQNFVTLTPTVQVTTGDIRQEVDMNKIITKIETYMENELVSSAEGVYA